MKLCAITFRKFIRFMRIIFCLWSGLYIWLLLFQ